MATAPPPFALPRHPHLTFQQLKASDVPRAAELETASYPADEAATPEKLEYRQRVAPELFYGVYEAEKLIAFVVSTCAVGKELEEETMSTHEPGGDSVCIHSVCVDAAKRRQGIAEAMVKAYVDAIARDAQRCGSAKRALLIAHAELCGLYARCGFEFLGRSKVVHGSEPWYDMRLDLLDRRRLDFCQVDAFTPAAFGGNPAAVLFTQRNGDETWMQAVAIENNLSETAFLEPRIDGANGSSAHWDIRWFTPGGEVDLCGHATLGSAHALWDTGRVEQARTITFHTRKCGELHCSNSGGGWIKMDFPSQPPTPEPTGPDFAAALGITSADIVHLGQGPATTPDWLVEVSAEAFERLNPDFGALGGVRPQPRGVIVTCRGSGELCPSTPPKAKRPRIFDLDPDCAKIAFDFKSRFFAPCLNIDEDPVTGSAHCVLAPYWSSKLGKSDGDTLNALQASSRGGVLRVRHRINGGAKTARVELEGQAVTVIRGKLSA